MHRSKSRECRERYDRHLLNNTRVPAQVTANQVAAGGDDRVNINEGSMADYTEWDMDIPITPPGAGLEPIYEHDDNGLPCPRDESEHPSENEEEHSSEPAEAHFRQRIQNSVGNSDDFFEELYPRDHATIIRSQSPPFSELYERLV
jgi:hypothetical protein